MADTTPTAPAGLLRPLGFGELFDRAVTLYIRNFTPFSLIVLVVMLPYALAQYSMQARSLAQLGTMLGRPGAKPVDPLSGYGSLGDAAFAILLVLTLLVVLPFVFGAVAMGVARLYRGEAVDLRSCYGRALRHVGRMFGLMGMNVLIFLGIYFGIALSTFLLVAITVGVGQLGTAGLVAGIVVDVVAGIAAMGLLIVVILSMGFSILAVVIEERRVFDAIGEGFSRVFSRGEFGRALLFALAWAAISLVSAGTVYAFMFLALYLHQPWIVTVENVVVTTVSYAFSTVLLAVYYYDVRIRREGLDLETQLESLASTAPA